MEHITEEDEGSHDMMNEEEEDDSTDQQPMLMPETTITMNDVTADLIGGLSKERYLIIASFFMLSFYSVLRI